ncbi:MAG: protein kinase [Planctomycetes bacterium]|nr:protein kinase [Planctomycetota bacterium]
MRRKSSRVRLAKIGKYQILEKIGTGGQGKVYKGLDRNTGQFVAIKMIPVEAAEDREQGLRFAQECQVTKKLDHPHILRVLDFGMEGQKPFLVMEFVDGENLMQRLTRDGKIPPAEAVRLLSQVGHALNWTHQRQLIHRDIKPANILITKNGDAKLTDFGIAKNLEGEFQLTQPCSWLGTPSFMSPEQFEDAKRADALCDLYSLAATLYMTITGVIPFRGRSASALAAIYKKKLANDIVPPRQLVPETSERVNAAILQGMRADRRERHASMAAFLEALLGEESAAAAANAINARADSSAPQAPASGKERRILKRYPCGQSAACQPMERVVPWVGKVVNISQTGLCVELPRRFEPGAILQIALPAKDTERNVIVRVMWVKRQAEKLWQMGCQYDYPLYDFEVDGFRVTKRRGDKSGERPRPRKSSASIPRPRQQVAGNAR